jgi:NAD(P) transhydrogenase subunit beta
MAIAVVATLLYEQVGDWVLIASASSSARRSASRAPCDVKMTAMPQMVALFNGVGGGAIALIAWAEFRERNGDLTELEFGIPLVFAAIVGSISFWGSNIAFAKLQELIGGKPIKVPGGAILNGLLLLVAVGCGIAILAGSDNELLFIGLLVAAASSATRSSCRSAARTCRSSSRRSTPSPA